MRSVIALAVRRPVTVAMTALAVAAFGVVGYSRLPVELFPDISYPSITVRTEFPDTAPQEVETLVTRPVEEAVGVLRGLRTIHSVSRPGTSEVTLEFSWGADMDLLGMEVREKLDRIVLPEAAEDPVILRFDPSLEPVLRIALSGGEDLAALRRLAERRIKTELETLDGVAAAQVQGGFEEEIRIELDQERLAALEIPLDAIRRRVGAANVNAPGGALRGEDSHYLIRTLNEFDTVEEIADLVVWSYGGASVRLRDVADVSRGRKEREVITRVEGEESVELSIFKEGDANTVTVVRAVRSALGAWEGNLPPGHELTVLFDPSVFIQRSIQQVRNAALVGGVLAITILLVFLRDLRSTVIIATSIPLSVVATFLLLYRLDISLNVMSLGGLTLAIGMLVDSSIVVLESIHRRRTGGLPRARAAVEGAAEIGPAVLASTLTTVAVFLPIVFVEGIAGELFEDQAVTVTIGLLASLVVALTVIPMLSAAGAPLPGAGGPGGGGGEAASGAFGAVRPTAGTGTPPSWGRFGRGYDRLVRGAVDRRGLTLLVAGGLFGLSVLAVRSSPTELIPVLSEGVFFFEVRMPEGTSLAATDRVVSSMEEGAGGHPDVERHFASVGSRTVAGGMSLDTRGENLGQLYVALHDGLPRESETRVAQALRRRFEGVPDLEVKLGRPSYFSLDMPVEVIVYGDDLETLRDYSLDLAGSLEAVPGLVDVRSSLEAGNPEIQVRFDRRRLANLGLELETLTGTLRSRVQGAVPTRYRLEDRQIDVRLRNMEGLRDSLQDVRQLVVPGPEGRPVRLLTLADVQVARGPAEIHRIQQQRAAVITANLAGRTLGSAVRAVEEEVAAAPPPANATVDLGGQVREMEVSFRSLLFAIGLAVFLVYLVMASTFESFLHPFVVLFTIPLSLTGVAAGLRLTGTPVSVIVLIGGILLVGIVVNNAIVLIDTVLRLRRSGLDVREAAVRAGHVRLRPILMTTLTTVLGLLPMALGGGEGAELRRPLAVTVASGLLGSTLLTLLVIPAACTLLPGRSAARGGDGPDTARAGEGGPGGDGASGAAAGEDLAREDRDDGHGAGGDSGKHHPGGRDPS